VTSSPDSRQSTAGSASSAVAASYTVTKSCECSVWNRSNSTVSAVAPPAAGSMRQQWFSLSAYDRLDSPSDTMSSPPTPKCAGALSKVSPPEQSIDARARAASSATAHRRIVLQSQHGVANLKNLLRHFGQNQDHLGAARL
jgi:hypothetical protein